MYRPFRRLAAIRRPAILLAGAGDHVACDGNRCTRRSRRCGTQSRDRRLEAPAALTGSDDLPAWFVPGNHTLVASALCEMLVINASNIGAANSRGLHAQQHFPWHGAGTATVRNSTVEFPGGMPRSLFLSSLYPYLSNLACARYSNYMHQTYGGVISPWRSHRSSQAWPSFQRNTGP